MQLVENTSPSVSSIEDVWARFRSGDLSCRSVLLEEYLPLVYLVAKGVYHHLAGQVAMDDLISTGTFGLMDAVKSFDPGRGVKFKTYCRPRIRGAMLDDLRSTDWVPRLTRSRHHQLSEAMQALEATTGRQPTDAEISAELHMSLMQVRKLQCDSIIPAQTSLERSFTLVGEIETCLRDMLPSQRQESPEDQALCQDLKEMIKKGLTKAERLVLQLYYYEGLTMRETGDALDISESRICQINSDILARLRAKFDSHGVSPRSAA